MEPVVEDQRRSTVPNRTRHIPTLAIPISQNIYMYIQIALAQHDKKRDASRLFDIKLNYLSPASTNLSSLQKKTINYCDCSNIYPLIFLLQLHHSLTVYHLTGKIDHIILYIIFVLVNDR